MVCGVWCVLMCVAIIVLLVLLCVLMSGVLIVWQVVRIVAFMCATMTELTCGGMFVVVFVSCACEVCDVYCVFGVWCV